LRGRAVAQHLGALERAGRQQREIHRLRTARGDVDERRAVEAPAVDQHQRVIGREIPQRGRPHEDRTVGGRDAPHVIGGHDCLELAVEIGRRGLAQILRRNDVDRHVRFQHRALRAPRAGHDDLFELLIVERGADRRGVRIRRIGGVGIRGQDRRDGGGNRREAHD
jgi:hypothetical protein